MSSPGYLITTLLLNEEAKTLTIDIDLKEFYARRAYRILAAAIAFMLPVFVIFWHSLRWYHMLAGAHSGGRTCGAGFGARGVSGGA